MPLKRKTLNWIIFAVLILVFFGFLLLLQSWEKTQEPSPSATEETGAEKPGKGFAVPELTPEEKKDRDNDALNQALLSGKGCEDIKYDDELKQLCLDTLAYYEAVRVNDESLCAQISDAALKTKCYDQVYLNIGIKQFNKNLCEKIIDPAVKQNCSDQVIALSGILVKNVTDCDAVKDAALRQTCLDNYYFAASAGGLDASGCVNISNTDIKDRCAKTVAKNIEVTDASKKQAVRTYQTAEQQIKNCDSMSGADASSCKDQANFSLAGEKKDISYCGKITDSQLQNSCVQTQSISINNYYLKQAVRLNDASLCGKILDAELRSDCVSNIK